MFAHFSVGNFFDLFRYFEWTENYEWFFFALRWVKRLLKKRMEKKTCKISIRLMFFFLLKLIFFPPTKLHTYWDSLSRVQVVLSFCCWMKNYKKNLNIQCTKLPFSVFILYTNLMISSRLCNYKSILIKFLKNLSSVRMPWQRSSQKLREIEVVDI